MLEKVRFYLFFTNFFVFARVESILPKKSSIDFLLSSSGLIKAPSLGLASSFFGEFDADKRDDADDEDDDAIEKSKSFALFGNDNDFVN